MWKMLPIPALLSEVTSPANRYSVRQRQRFLWALVYLCATASLCYLFLFALVISNENEAPRQSGRELGIWQQLALVANNSEKHLSSSNNTSENSHRQLNKESNRSVSSLSTSTLSSPRTQPLLDVGRKTRSSKSVPSPSTSTLSSSRTQPFDVGRKTLFSLIRKKGEKTSTENGAWRSHSTKIRPGHQDLGWALFSQYKGYKHSSKPTAVSYYPWRKDEQCKSFNVHFAEKNTFKPRALVSFPGSGNSWLRYLIESASGYFTGSVYDDMTLYNSGLLGEFRPPDDGSTIVQKTHDTVVCCTKYIKGYQGQDKLAELMFGYRGILVIRNPYEALISFRNWLKSKANNRHMGIARTNVFYGEEWTTFVTTYISRWSSLIMTWIENSHDYLIVLYEDIKKNPRKELIRILKYLDQPVCTERLDCLMKKEHLEGPFHRTHNSTQETSHHPLSVDLNPSNTTNSTTSQQDTKIRFEDQPLNVELSSHKHQLGNNEHPLLQLDSEKSQQPHQQQHLQSLSPPKRTTTPIERGKEQKEDKFLSSPLSFQAISSTNSLQQQQNQYTSNMTSGSSNGKPAINNATTSSLTDDKHNDHDNNRLNKGSILRLDLIIQDNIDKINRFFQHKSIPVQLQYSPRPSTMPYFLQTYIAKTNATKATTTTSTSTITSPFSLYNFINSLPHV